MTRVPVTLYTDPGCPFAYSAMPALARLRWRFGDSLRWRVVMIGLAETPEQYEERGYTPLDMALGTRKFRRHGMPFTIVAKDGVAATSRACRAVVAVRTAHPGREWAALRALALLHFTSDRRLDDDGAIEDALAAVAGVDAAAIVAAIDDPAVLEAYEDDRAESRMAAGTPASSQDKTATTDGPERFTAPTLVIDDRWTAGGFQPYATYDALLANVDPDLPRRDPPEDVAEVLAAFPDGLTTAEIGAIMTSGIDEPVPDHAEAALVEAAANGRAERVAAGDGAVWLPATGALVRHAAPGVA